MRWPGVGRGESFSVAGTNEKQLEGKTDAKKRHRKRTKGLVSRRGPRPRPGPLPRAQSGENGQKWCCGDRMSGGLGWNIVGAISSLRV